MPLSQVNRGAFWFKQAQFGFDTIALARTQMNEADTMKNEDKEIKQLIISNAKAIQALTTSIADLKEEWQKDRKGIYQLLGQLTRSMSDFYETQSDFYHRFEQIEDRQARMLEILNRLAPEEDNPV